MSESLTAKIPRMHSPVNRLAALVTRPGIRYEETFVSKSEIVSEAPLQTRPYPVNSRPEDDLTGRKCGRFTVVGLGVSSAHWVVRCACGRYCYRKAKVLKQQEFESECAAMCPRCAAVERAKKSGLRLQGRDWTKANLHAAALPMYEVLVRILSGGLTDANRRAAIDAVNMARGIASKSEVLA